MQVTDNQIKFIDQYLENSGIKYLDIRYEMTDLIATALEEKEGVFYDEFQAYMAKNKAELLSSAKKFSKAATIRAFKMLVKGFVKPQFYIVATILFTVALLLDQRGYNDAVFTGFTILYFLLCGVIFSSYVHMVVINKKPEWSGVNRFHYAAALTVYILFLVVKPQNVFKDDIYLFLYYAVIISFVVMMISSYLKLKKMYKLRFNE
ncbi:hypothetical protein V1389_03135 [Flavobacterium rakeshii]|uniref:hypothetical protein n=1 Tax=Flavobacterium rakeshii TaxID=1038845 RepID=UPI002E7B873C|nr:hypothetical protein [Flavobacterium rakeshii]MEE1897314.1 hypothetical protein [Flavobacterium rakeshii]